MGHTQAPSMEVSGLFSVLDNTAFPGGSLSVEERAALQASLILLKESQHFKEVRFWGKVRGLARDYLVCQGTIDEACNVAPFDCKRVTFKSTDGVVWTTLAEVDEEMMNKCAACTIRVGSCGRGAA